MAIVIRAFIDKITNDEINFKKLLFEPNDFNPKNNYDYNLLKSIIIKRLQEKPKSSKYKLFKLLNLTEEDIIKKKILQPTKYNIYGCPLSTDIDIAFIVSSPQDILEYRSSLAILDVDDILIEIKKNYCENAKFDINLITLDSQNNLSMAYKGSKETQNIIFNTYQYHKQEYACFFDKQIDIDLNDKIRGLTVFVLDYLEDIIGKKEYSNKREIKKRIYNDPIDRIKFVNEILNLISNSNSNSISNSNSNSNSIEDFLNIDKSIIKSITMKLIQIILLSNDKYAYTKKDMIDLILENIIIDRVNIRDVLWNLLTRDKLGNVNSCENKILVFNHLVKLYIDIYDELINLYQWSEININFNIDYVKNPTEISDDIIREFIKSPIIPTQKFLEIGKEILDGNINEHFILKCYGLEFLPLSIHKYIIYEPQRSKNWEIFHQKFNEGKLKITGDKFSMMRGAIGEIFITQYCDFNKICGENVRKSMIGFITDEDNNACAPDLLLINDLEEIIPVEIKCLPMNVCFDINNRAFYREFKLAKKQIKYCSKIINNIYLKKVKKSIIIFVYIHDVIRTFYLII